MPPSSYYLIANYPTISLVGVTVNADAYYTAAGADVIQSPDGGGVGIAWAGTTNWLDRVAWNRSGASQAPRRHGDKRFVLDLGMAQIAHECCHPSIPVRSPHRAAGTFRAGWGTRPQRVSLSRLPVAFSAAQI